MSALLSVGTRNGHFAGIRRKNLSVRYVSLRSSAKKWPASRNEMLRHLLALPILLPWQS